MTADVFGSDVRPVQGAVPARRAVLDAASWRNACVEVEKAGGRLVALWAGYDGSTVHAALGDAAGLIVLTAHLAAREYPDISDVFPAAVRMQRAAFDLSGVRAAGAGDTRRWLRHGAWPADAFPLRSGFPLEAAHAAEPDDYAFVAVGGDGVHEIPVGPVHAGTIEPGHFRFSIVGERVLRLEERLGYKHKGVEKLFENKGLSDGSRLAGRVSGDSTVAYAWAYAMAVESAAGSSVPPRALWLRALLLERERIANHLGDLGFLGNDAGLAFGLAQFSALKEDVLRLNAALFGHRYLMDLVVPGGVVRDVDAAGKGRLLEQCDALASSVATLKAIYDDHPGLQDRFMNCGRVTPELAARLGLVGCAGRASAQALDLRVQFPPQPYDALAVNLVTHRSGDVAARVQVRFGEIVESLRLVREILQRLPQGEIGWPAPAAPAGALGIGWVEGWRGEIFVALETGADNTIRRLHPHDPSWQNWPVLEHAVLGNIVPDFPLINKSFNLSYSGHDL